MLVHLSLHGEGSYSLVSAGRSDFLWPYRISAIIDLGFDTCVPPVRPVYVCGNVSSVATRG